MTRTMERVLSAVTLSSTNWRLLLLHADEDTMRAVIALGVASDIVLSHRSLATVHAVMRMLAIPTIGTPTIIDTTTITVHHAHGVTQAMVPMHEAGYDSALIRLPTDSQSAQLLLLHAASVLPAGALVHVIGGTNEGVRSLVAAMRGAFDLVHTAAHAGGVHLVIGTHRGEETLRALQAQCAPFDDPAFMLAQHVIVPGRNVAVEAYVRPGVFSLDHPDEATLLLAQHMSVLPNADVLDLGCGSGILGAVLLATGGARSITLVDADCESVRCATETMQGIQRAGSSFAHDGATAHSEHVTRKGARPWRVLASDVTSAVRGEQFDVVLSNPPFHAGKATDLALPTRFIHEAAGVLRDGGVFQLVANRTLPYEPLLERVFGNRRVVHDGRRFKVLEARVTPVPPQ